MGDEKAQVLAFDREKRVYKDAYVTNLRKVRHFPALATIGAGRSDGESIILVQEPTGTSTSGCDATMTATNRRARSTLDKVPGRLLPPDSVGDCGLVCKATNDLSRLCICDLVQQVANKSCVVVWLCFIAGSDVCEHAAALVVPLGGAVQAHEGAA